jgi:uncharacterized protein YjiK
LIVIILFFIGCSSSSETDSEESLYGNILSIKEASGIGYCSKTDTLFVAADNGILYEISKNGKVLNEKNLSTLKNHDFEGIAYDEKNDEIVVAVEGSDNVLVLNTDLLIQRTVNVDREDEYGKIILEKDKENGLEGIVVFNGDIYLSNQSFKNLAENDPSVVIKIDFTDLYSAHIGQIIDHGFINISGLAIYGNYLYMVTDSDNLLIKYDLTANKVITTYKIKDFDTKLKGIAVEGVTFDNNENIYFAADNDGRIYKFKFN